MDIIIAKQRVGPTGAVKLHCEMGVNLVCDFNDAPAKKDSQEAFI